jgi:hypothetical protein
MTLGAGATKDSQHEMVQCWAVNVNKEKSEEEHKNLLKRTPELLIDVHPPCFVVQDYPSRGELRLLSRPLVALTRSQTGTGTRTACQCVKLVVGSAPSLPRPQCQHVPVSPRQIAVSDDAI